VTVAAAQLLTPRLLRGHRRTTAIALACGTWALAWTLTLIAGNLGHHTGAQVAFAAALAVFALGERMLSPTFAAIINDIAPDHLQGRCNGLSTLAFTTGFLLGPAIAGAALGTHHGTALLLALITARALAAPAATRLARALPAAANHIGPPPAPTASNQTDADT
jgi:MFS family permease